MSALENYFKRLIERVEASATIQNNGKDGDGFYKPTRTVVLRQLNMLKDLHGKERARAMCKDAWSGVVEVLPPDWLVLSPEEKAELQKMLS